MKGNNNILLLSIKRTIYNYRILKIIQKRFPGTIIEENVIIKGNINNLRLGKNVIIQTGTVLHLGGLEWCQNSGFIEIGENSCISPNCVIYGCGPGGVHIGKGFDCGPGVGIFASRTDYSRGRNHHIFAPVRIGSDVIVYANAVISPGAVIGDHAVIAAGSVVNEDIPENVLAGGAPARVIKKGIRERSGLQVNDASKAMGPDD